MLGVLHTWSRTLMFHPHVPFLVPGGGLSPGGRSWIPARKNYLLNVKAPGARFRTLFQQRLQEEDPELFDRVPAKIWRRRWVVDCRPVGSGEHALTYRSRYLFKSATGERDGIVLPGGRVRWPYRRSDTGGQASIDLEPHQLISRFLQHGLPRGFHRVRGLQPLNPGARLPAIAPQLGHRDWAVPLQPLGNGQNLNVIFVDAPGVGKTPMAIALGYPACLQGHLDEWSAREKMIPCWGV